MREEPVIARPRTIGTSPDEPSSAWATAAIERWLFTQEVKRYASSVDWGCAVHR